VLCDTVATAHDVAVDMTSSPPRAGRSGVVAAAAAALALASAGVLASAPHARAATVTVEISNFAYQPATVTIQVGDTVTWTNLDAAAHTATDTGPQGLFDGVIDQGESFSYTFTQAGTFNYFCTFHTEMSGTVIVQAASAGGSQVPDAAMGQPAAPSPSAFAWAVSALGAALLVFGLFIAISVKRRQA
jgi:plastocyanin